MSTSISSILSESTLPKHRLQDLLPESPCKKEQLLSTVADLEHKITSVKRKFTCNSDIVEFGDQVRKITNTFDLLKSRNNQPIDSTMNDLSGSIIGGMAAKVADLVGIFNKALKKKEKIAREAFEGNN